MTSLEKESQGKADKEVLDLAGITVDKNAIPVLSRLVYAVPTKRRYQGVGKDPMSRVSWDEYFMEITKLVAKRSTCLRRRVGAIIVRDKHILATGYNGAPAGLPHCLDIGCYREKENIPSGERHELCRGLHAEQNAIIQAANHGASLKESTLYTTTHPCIICTKMIINSGINKVIYLDGYADNLSRAMIEESSIEVLQVKETSQ